MSDHEFGVPPQHSSTPPEHYRATKEDWILQQLHNSNRELGVVSSEIKALREEITKTNESNDVNSGKINQIRIALATATGALIVIGYFVDKRFDQMIALLSP